MLKISIIIFREFLEIALMLGIITAVTKPIKNSLSFIIAGMLLGSTLASIAAFFINYLHLNLGTEDDIFNVVVILLSAALISWTTVWMQGYSYKIKNNVLELTDQINNGMASKSMLMLVVAVTIFRETVEILLFIYSVSTTETIDYNHYIWGIIVGAISGTSVGLIIYKGLVGYSGKYIFKISSLMLIFIAAGLASQGAGILTSSGLVEIYSNQLWDTSNLIDNNSFLGKILSITLGYDSRPSQLQAIFYGFTIIFTLSMIYLRKFLNKYSQ